MTFGALEYTHLCIRVSVFLSVVYVTVCFETAVYTHTHTEMNCFIDAARNDCFFFFPKIWSRHTSCLCSTFLFFSWARRCWTYGVGDLHVAKSFGFWFQNVFSFLFNFCSAIISLKSQNLTGFWSCFQIFSVSWSSGWSQRSVSWFLAVLPVSESFFQEHFLLWEICPLLLLRSQLVLELYLQVRPTFSCSFRPTSVSVSRPRRQREV